MSIDDESSPGSSSEDEAANRASISPQTSPAPSSPTGSAPSGTPCPYPPSSPCSPCSYLSSSPTSSSSCLDGLDLASPCSSQDADSVCGSGHVSPLLGPRSQCSGASSPDCDQERGVCSWHRCVAALWMAVWLSLSVFSVVECERKFSFQKHEAHVDQCSHVKTQDVSRQVSITQPCVMCLTWLLFVCHRWPSWGSGSHPGVPFEQTELKCS